MPHSPDRKASSSLATAAMLEMIMISLQYQSAVIRGADGSELDAIRGKGHDMLDAYLDRSGEAAKAVAGMVEDHPDAEALRAIGAKRLLEP